MEKLQITKDVPCNYTGKNEFIIWDSEGVALCGVNNEDLAKLICNSINTYQQCEELPSELLRQNREMKECLKYAIIMLPDGQVKKDCEQTLKSLEQ